MGVWGRFRSPTTGAGARVGRLRRATLSDRTEGRKEEIITGLDRARACILAAAAALPAEKRDEVLLGVWSMKELLAHLVGWDYTTIWAAREIWAGTRPSFYDHRDRGWKSCNAELVARQRTEGWAAMVSLVAESHRRLIEYVLSVPPEVFDSDRSIRVGRYKVTIGRLLDAEIKDEWEHCQ